MVSLRCSVSEEGLLSWCLTKGSGLLPQAVKGCDTDTDDLTLAPRQSSLIVEQNLSRGEQLRVILSLQTTTALRVVDELLAAGAESVAETDPTASTMTVWRCGVTVLHALARGAFSPGHSCMCKRRETGL